MITSRRSFLVGMGGSLVAAPAVVRAASLMPIRGIFMDVPSATLSVRWEGYGGGPLRYCGTELVWDGGGGFSHWGVLSREELIALTEPPLFPVGDA